MPNKRHKEPFKGLHVRVQLIKEGTPQYDRPIRCPEDVVEIVSEIRAWDREVFLTIALDIRNQVLGIETTAIGSVSATPINPREVFKAVLLANASSVIFAHLHPSGCAEPSAEDKAMTRHLVEGARLLGIEVLDHIIITHNKHFSFVEEGLLAAVRAAKLGQSQG